jgi:hypothetical protein
VLTRAKRILRKAATDPLARRRLPGQLVRYAKSGLTRQQTPKRLDAISSMPIPTGPIARPDLTVAVILDPFSELAYRYEWNQVLCSPADWRLTLESRPPDLLFVESAWNGNRGAWRLAMSTERGPSQPL